MKMSEEHYNFLLEACREKTEEIKEEGKTILQNNRFRDFSIMLLFNVFHFCKVYTAFSPQEFGYQDAHIKTAMKKIFKELNISTNQEDYK